MKKYNIYADSNHQFEVKAKNEEEANLIAHDKMYSNEIVDEVTFCECSEVRMGVYSVYASSYNRFDVNAKDEDDASTVAHNEMYMSNTISEVIDIYEINEL